MGQRYTEVRNPMTERIEYYDIKSSYAHSMTQSLPFGDHHFIDIGTLKELEELVYQLDLNREGILVNIDCYTPVHLHDFFKGVPPICEKTIFSPNMYPLEFSKYRQP